MGLVAKVCYITAQATIYSNSILAKYQESLQIAFYRNEVTQVMFVTSHRNCSSPEPLMKSTRKHRHNGSSSEDDIQLHLSQWQVSYFELKSTLRCYYGFNSQQISTGSGIALVRQQAISRNTAEPVHRRIYTSLNINGVLDSKWVMYQGKQMFLPCPYSVQMQKEVKGNYTLIILWHISF